MAFAKRYNDPTLMAMLETARKDKLYGRAVHYDKNKVPVVIFNFTAGECKNATPLIIFDSKNIFERSIKPEDF